MGSFNYDMFSKILLMVLLPFVFVALIIPFIKNIAIRIGAVDIARPNTRHIHTKDTPRLGGLAIFLGFLLGYMVFGTHSSIMNAVLIGSFIIILVGVIDDISELGPFVKLIGQLASAAIIVFYGGLLIEDIDAFGIYSWLYQLYKLNRRFRWLVRWYKFNIFLNNRYYCNNAR
jgi:UDP-GlcNAc:undecaprenyl-phosphate GlcNAc-1-phosphate transferase